MTALAHDIPPSVLADCTVWQIRMLLSEEIYLAKHGPPGATVQMTPQQAAAYTANRKLTKDLTKFGNK